MADSLRHRSPRRSPRSKVSDQTLLAAKEGKKLPKPPVEDKENYSVSQPVPSAPTKSTHYQPGTDPNTIRFNLIRENITSEEAFVAAICQIHTLFFDQMQRIQAHHEIGIGIKTLKAMSKVSGEYFQQLMAILSKHVEIPLNEVGNILLKIAGKLDTFKPFVCHYKSLTQDFLPALIDAKPAIKQLIEDNNNEGKVGHSQVTFSDMLIMPVQRITRYIGLAEGLVKTCSAAHPAPVELTEALTKLKATADEINAETRDIEEQVKVLKQKTETFTCLKEIPYIIAPHRYHVKDFYVNIPKPNSNVLGRGIVLLFNNLIVVCKIDEKNHHVMLGYSELAVTFFGKDSINLQSTRRHIVTENDNWCMDLSTVSAAKDFDTLTWNEIEQGGKRDSYYAAKRDLYQFRYDASTNSYDVYKKPPSYCDRVNEREWESQKTAFTQSQVVALQNSAVVAKSPASGSDLSSSSSSAKDETPLTPRRSGTPKKERGGILGFISPRKGN